MYMNITDVMLSLFMEDIILYGEDSNESTKNYQN